jgi:hypothetical protein
MRREIHMDTGVDTGVKNKKDSRHLLEEKGKSI